MRALTFEERIKLILGTVFILGTIVRFAPGFYTGFPLNDGGMFYSMILDLHKSNYLLPITTSYNFFDIPYAYPPLGFYLVRALSDILHISELSLLRWVPPIISTLSILVFYLLATELLDSRLRGAIATSIYTLTPDSFSWFIMGGGLTRALGSVFLILSVWSVYLLFKHEKKQFLFYATLFCAFAVVSHPEAGIHTAASCALLWLFFGKTRQKTFYAIIIIIGTLIFSAPWWLAVISKHGLTPFISALHSGLYGTSVFKAIFLNIFSRQSFVPILFILRLAGIIWSIWKRHLFLLFWAVLPFIVEPRSAASVAFYPLSMLTALGFTDAFPALFHRFYTPRKTLNNKNETTKFRWSDIILFTMLFYFFVECYFYGFRQVNTSLTTADRVTMSWVRENTPVESNFLLLTGAKSPEIDAFQEWFPALSARHSQTTIQGLEWQLGSKFFGFYKALSALQTCNSVNCVETWSMRNELEFDYILLLKNTSSTDLSLALENASKYEMVYQTNETEIYKYLR